MGNRCCTAWCAILLVISTLAGSSLAGNAENPAQAPKAPPCAVAKNVFIFIADGGGFNAYNAASYYEFGRLGCQPYDQPEWIELASQSNPLHPFAQKPENKPDEDSGAEVDPYLPQNVWDARLDAASTSAIARGLPVKGYRYLTDGPTDSAASATAMAMGRKTINGRINVIQDSCDTAWLADGQNIAEIADSMGMSAGVVTTVQWNDATPAAFGAAHDPSRTDRRQLAIEMLTSRTLDVIMGAGHPEYDQNGAPRTPDKETDFDIVGGSVMWDRLRTATTARHWKLIQTRSDFESLASGRMRTSGPVFGLARVSGATQHERQTRDWNRDGAINAADIKVAPPFKDPFIPTSPSLATMSLGAINVLSQNPNGFFIMIEGGAVDHAAHNNQPGRLIEEQIDYNRAVRAVLGWIQTHGGWRDNLVIITADHETGMVWGPDSDLFPFEPLTNRGAGHVPAMWFNSGGHSRSLVPLMARGPGASLFESFIIGDDPAYGAYVQNTSIFEVMNAAITGKAPRRLPEQNQRTIVQLKTGVMRTLSSKSMTPTTQGSGGAPPGD